MRRVAVIVGVWLAVVAGVAIGGYNFENGAALLMIEKYAGLCPPGTSCSSIVMVSDSYGVSSINVP